MEETAFGSFDLSGGGTVENTPFGAFGLGSDMAEAQQLQPFIPAPAQQQGMAWWESLVAYGATRAIDNRFGPVNVQGNTAAGSFAGQNGRTYLNTPQQSGGQTVQRQQAQQTQQAGGLGMLAIAAAAFFAFT